MFDLAYDECLVSDESDLLDFLDFEANTEATFARIEAHYLINVRPLGSHRIVDTLEFLRDRGVAA